MVDGGRGKDAIETGKGRDLIIHRDGDGKDTVFDFKPGKDVLDLSDHGFSGFKDLKSAMTDKKDKLIIDLPGKDKIVLEDIKLSDLSSDDFVL